MFDSHCHIHFTEFDQDRPEVLERAYKASVKYMLLVGCDVDTCERGILTAQENPNMWVSLGIHPHEASVWSFEIEQKFVSWIKADRQKKIVAIGEIGLDFFRNLSSHQDQERALIAQIDLAKSFDLPVIIHCRDAHAQVFEILARENVPNVLFHCFSGNFEFAKRVWDKGWHVSFAGVITYPKNQDLRDIVAENPRDLFLIETDCPYLPPQPMRGKRNEPAYLKYTLETVARMRGLSLAEADSLIEFNSRRFFRISS